MSEAIATRSLPRPAISGRGLALLLLAAVIVIAVAAASPGFLTGQNLKSAMSSIAITGIAAVGLTAITVSGNLFSLSTGALAGATAVAYALLLDSGMGVASATTLALCFAMLVGLIQGVVVAAGMNPIVTTLACGGLLVGLAPNVSPPIMQLDSGSEVWIGQTTLIAVSLPVVLFLLVTVVATLLMKKTRPGRRMYLTGANPDSARAAGLTPAVATCLAFTGASVAVGLAGIVGSAQVGLVTMSAMTPLTFSTITAVVVGGAALRGGRGTPIATGVAAVLVGLIENVVALHGFSYGVQLSIQGLMVCAAVVGYAHLSRGRYA